jgi:hypothetical protein
MSKLTVLWRLAAAATLVAAAAGCHDHDGDGMIPGTQQPTSFTAFTKSTFAAAADSTPVQINFLIFDFDADNDPTAFSGLLD